jgi:hypothetical protein
MDFIQDYGAVIQTSKERLRIFQHPPYPRQLAIEVLDVGQASAKISLTHPPNPGKPYNRAPFPSTVYLLQPKSAIYHMQGYYHLVLLNAKQSASGDAERTLCFPAGVYTAQTGHAFLVSEKFSLFTLRGRLTGHRYDIFAKHDAIPLT